MFCYNVNKTDGFKLTSKMSVERHCAAVVFFFIFNLQWANPSGIGPCPRLHSGESKINLTKLTGHWFEIERSFYLMELISNCVTLELSETVKGRLDVAVSTRSSWTGTFSISEGTAVPTRRDPNMYLYRINTRLPRIINRYLPGSGFYQVLKTDYSNYAIIYSCSNYQLIHLDMIWIWSRKKEIEASLRSELYAWLTKNNMDSERLILSKNDNCTDNVLSALDYYI
ncbi:unnamed protein product [Phyllotreta striolata]|uniref:Lipocalin/cytosolic fatty-acid binding domain-containing protein n=1 Tax=Phyllotreta striolata TaxID=444603 RepID=A0A9N9XPA9_PHYSR|nr:unnamed protein product [Phyllotreta striolata]